MPKKANSLAGWCQVALVQKLSLQALTSKTGFYPTRIHKDLFMFPQGKENGHLLSCKSQPQATAEVEDISE